MNPIKWLACWWHKRHIPMMRIVIRGGVPKRVRFCIRCGKTIWEA